MEHFSILLDDIRRQDGACHSATVAPILSKAQSTLEELDQLLQVKFLRNIHSTSRARKRAWARNRSKVYKMQNDLKELRASLIAAMGASSLLVCWCYLSLLMLIALLDLLLYVLK